MYTWLSKAIHLGQRLPTHSFGVAHYTTHIDRESCMCCSVLQRVGCAAVCCSVLQCVAVCCSVFQCAAVWCSVLQWTYLHKAGFTWRGALQRIHSLWVMYMLQGAAVWCSVVSRVCAAVCSSVLQYVAVCCSVLQCVAVRFIWGGTIHHVHSSCVIYALQCVTMCCGVLQCVAVCCSVL